MDLALDTLGSDIFSLRDAHHPSTVPTGYN